jgi:hypothetical protein
MSRIRALRITRLVVALIVCSTALASAGPAQRPLRPSISDTTDGSADSIVIPHRAPTIALVQPVAGSVITSDRVVLLFHVSPGEPDDPVDLASLLVRVNGEDRTGAFQVALVESGHEAWGNLSADDARRPRAGTIEVMASICSGRGVCAVVRASIEVEEPPRAEPEGARPTSKGRLVLLLLVELVRRLIHLW